jgi:nitrite reductase/ring-hydroxylating ferredoxin subunit
MKKMKKLLALLIGFGMMAACEPDMSDDPIPYRPFDLININLNLPEYINLKTDGGFYYLDEGGYKGTLIYRQNASTYIAYDRYCSYQPNSVCATVEVHVSTLYMLCPCCSSTFDLATGYPTGGPAWRPLRKYETSLNGSELAITDQIVE